MNSSNEIPNDAIKNLNFKNRPIYISHKYRVIYQVCRTILIIGMVSTVHGCSPHKLQIISDSLDDIELLKTLEAITKDEISHIPKWKYSQMLSKTVTYCCAEKLIEHSNSGKLKLTDKGSQLFKDIDDDPELFEKEKSNLNRLKKKLSEKKLDVILKRRINV